MSEAFEAERLRILEKVSSGEITPQEGSLQIAMLKVKFQEEAAPEPDEETTGLQEAAGAWRSEEGHQSRGGFQWRTVPADFKLTLPMIAMLAIPVLFVVGLLLGGMALVLAIPTLVLVLIWNAIAAAVPGAMPTLSFFPTLGTVMAAFILVSIVRGWWRTRLLMNMLGRSR